MTAKSPEERTAVFAGTFDPFTAGHASVVERGLALFDRVVIAVGANASKHNTTPPCQRVEAIERLYASEPRVRVIAYGGRLTVDVARECGAGWLLRGVRSVKDFEYERDMADLNRRLSGIDTVLLLTLPEHGAISSSALRDIRDCGGDISQFLPSKV